MHGALSPATCREVRLRALAAAAVVTFRSARWVTSTMAEPAGLIAACSAAPSAADMMQLGRGAVPAKHRSTVHVPQRLLWWWQKVVAWLRLVRICCFLRVR